MKLHPFTQFLMSIGIIKNVIGAFFTCLPGMMFGNVISIIGFVFAILAAVCLVFMLNLKKDGFYSYLVLTAFDILITSCYDGDWAVHLFAGGINIALLLGVLFLKKDGHNGYEALGIAKGK